MLIGLETGDWGRRFGTSSTMRRYWVTGFGTGARKQQTDRASVFLWRTEAMERRERFSEERNRFDAQMPTSQWTTKSTLLGLGLFGGGLLYEYDPERSFGGLLYEADPEIVSNYVNTRVIK